MKKPSSHYASRRLRNENEKNEKNETTLLSPFISPRKVSVLFGFSSLSSSLSSSLDKFFRVLRSSF